MSFLSTIESWFGSKAEEVWSILQPAMLLVKNEFTTIWGKVDLAVWSVVTDQIHQTIAKIEADVAASGKPMDIGTLVHTVWADVKGALPGLGVAVEDVALHTLISAIVAGL